MGTYIFKLPDLGEGIVESEVLEWYVAAGDQVQEDQHIADVMTDKATVEITSPVAGTVEALACEAGTLLPVGKELIRFEVEGEGQGQIPAAEHSEDKTPPGATPPNAAVARTATSIATNNNSITPTLTALEGGRVLASPAVRQRARDEEIDLNIIPGSGPAGRVTHKDLDAFIAAGGKLAAPAASRTQRRGSREIKLKGLRRVIAEKMQQSKSHIPHYAYVEEVDMTQLEQLRQHLNAHKQEAQPKLTLLPFIMQALVKLLPEFPYCNANFDNTTHILTEIDAVHIGIATMTGDGLMVPVIRHCETLDIWQSAAEITRLSEAARRNTAKAEELSGSTITLTSLGALGGIVSTPVINAPETTIIGINKLQERAVVKDGAIVVRKMMNLSSSFDHRIVDGFDGARLIQQIKRLLENPGAIFV